MKNQILLVNANEAFEEAFLAACGKYDLVGRSINVHDRMVFIVDGDEVRLVYDNEPFSVEGYAYALIRLRGKKPLAAAMFAQYLEHKHIPYMDRANRETALSDDKLVQMLRFGMIGLPIPKTIMFSREAYACNKETILNEIVFPCVLKQDGAKGNSVWKIASVNDLEERMGEMTKDMVMVQEYIPNTEDIRALVFKGELIGAIARRSTDGFYNNVSRGATTGPANLTASELDLAAKACSAVDLDFGGVDFIRTPTGIVFLEVNKSPQLNGFQAETGIDVASVLLEKISKQF